MKKLLLLAVFTIAVGFASQAQDSQTKVKKTSTEGRKSTTRLVNINITMDIK